MPDDLVMTPHDHPTRSDPPPRWSDGWWDAYDMWRSERWPDAPKVEVHDHQVAQDRDDPTVKYDWGVLEEGFDPATVPDDWKIVNESHPNERLIPTFPWEGD